nr:4314_t:CDS:2 [Entrophospora candida]
MLIDDSITAFFPYTSGGDKTAGDCIELYDFPDRIVEATFTIDIKEAEKSVSNNGRIIANNKTDPENPLSSTTKEKCWRGEEGTPPKTTINKKAKSTHHHQQQ